jgi:hypothetical protein
VSSAQGEALEYAVRYAEAIAAIAAQRKAEWETKQKEAIAHAEQVKAEAEAHKAKVRTEATKTTIGA